MKKLKKIGVFVKNKLLNVEFFFLLVAVIGFYCLLPPSLDFGDQASNGIVLQKNLIEYQKIRKNFEGNFEDYFRQRYVDFHGDKIFSFNAYETYGLNPDLKLSAYLDPAQQQVFVLSKLSELGIYYLSFCLLNTEASLKLLGFIIFILTYVYALKLGTLLKDKKFGLILAVIAVSNIYFNQVARSMLFPFLTFYPLLFFASFYYLIHLHLKKNKNRTRSLLGLSIMIAFCFINGYSNTNVMLLGLLGVFFLGFFLYLKLLGNPKYEPLPLGKYFKIAFLSFSVIIFTTAIWSYLLGQHLLFAFDEILHDRLLGLILSHQAFAGTNFVSDFWKIPLYLINAFEVLLVRSKLRLGPHEASFLNDLSFLNFVEGVFLFLGIYHFVKNIRSKRIINYFLIIMAAFFLFQLFSHPVNYLIVSRATFNFYFITIFFVAYGLYKFNKFSLIILLAILLVNINKFNTEFVLLFDESRQQMSGVYQLRQLYQNEISQDKNLFVYDYNLFRNGYEYHLDLISSLKGKIDYEIIDKFFSPNYINSLPVFKDFLKQGFYKNVYVLQPAGVIQIGRQLREPVKPFHHSDRKLSPWFSIYHPYLVTRNRRGSPTFFVYKFDKDYSYYTTELEDDKKSYQIDFEEKEKVDYIDFPGSIKKIEIEFSESDKLKLDFSQLSFDRFHFDFGKNSLVDIYNNFNYGHKISNIKETDAKLSHGPGDVWGRARVDLFDPVGKSSHVLFEYPVGFPIQRVHLVVPFVFFNNQMLENEFTLSYKTNEADNWKKIASRKSNRNLSTIDYNYFVMPTSLSEAKYNISNNYAFFRVLNLDSKTDQLFINYKIAAYMPPAVRPYSSSFFPEETFNFLEFEVDTSEYQRYREIPTRVLNINVEFKEEQKEKPHNLISVGTH